MDPAQDTRREPLADVQHEIWSHWMRYLFTRGYELPGGGYALHASDVERWRRQMTTSYPDLSEREKDSDREQADKVLAKLWEFE
jgi:hypothetical protein